MSRREAPGNFPPSLEHSPRGKFLGCFPLLPLTLAPPRSHRASNCARGARRAGRESPSAWYRRPRVINYPSAGLALSGRLSRQGSNRAAAGGWERSRSDSGRTQGPRRVWVHGGGRAGGEPSGPTTPRPAKGARGECSHRESGPERRPPAASGEGAQPASRPSGWPRWPAGREARRASLSPEASCSRNQKPVPPLWAARVFRTVWPQDLLREGRHFDQVFHTVRKIPLLSSGFFSF